MKSKETKSTDKSVKKAMFENLKTGLNIFLKETTAAFGSSSKKLEKEIKMGSAKLSKKLIKEIKIKKLPIAEDNSTENNVPETKSQETKKTVSKEVSIGKKVRKPV